MLVKIARQDRIEAVVVELQSRRVAGSCFSADAEISKMPVGSRDPIVIEILPVHLRALQPARNGIRARPAPYFEQPHPGAWIHQHQRQIFESQEIDVWHAA